MFRKILAALVGGAAIACAGQAAALEIHNCASGCTTDAYGGVWPVDYTVPSDGQAYRWDLWTDVAHSDLLIHLGSPNETFSNLKISNGDGTFSQAWDFPAFASIPWSEIQTPGHTTIFLKSPVVDFDNCSNSTPAGVICATKGNIWGNGVWLGVNAPLSGVRIFFSSTAVPEPGAWAMMLLGFFGVGAALRTRQTIQRSAA